MCVLPTDLHNTTISPSACTPHTLTPPSPSFSHQSSYIKRRTSQTYWTTSPALNSTHLHYFIYSGWGELCVCMYMYICVFVCVCVNEESGIVSKRERIRYIAE